MCFMSSSITEVLLSQKKSKYSIFCEFHVFTISAITASIDSKAFCSFDEFAESNMLDLLCINVCKTFHCCSVNSMFCQLIIISIKNENVTENDCVIILLKLLIIELLTKKRSSAIARFRNFDTSFRCFSMIKKSNFFSSKFTKSERLSRRSASKNEEFEVASIECE